MTTSPIDVGGRKIVPPRDKQLYADYVAGWNMGRLDLGTWTNNLPLPRLFACFDGWAVGTWQRWISEQRIGVDGAVLN